MSDFTKLTNELTLNTFIQVASLSFSCSFFMSHMEREMVFMFIALVYSICLCFVSHILNLLEFCVCLLSGILVLHSMLHVMQ